MSGSKSTYLSPSGLNEREQEILRLVVRDFVDTAGPVGSRSLARRYRLGLSPASIRNTMSDLESLGYLGHPYTSAGRMPTERGYRVFVDELMTPPDLPPNEHLWLKAKVVEVQGHTDEMFRESSRLLGHMSNLLGVVLSPKLSTGILERLDAVLLSSSRIMVVVSIKGGFVKTLVFEIDVQVKRQDLDYVLGILNERLAGLRLEEIRQTYATRTQDLGQDHTGFIRLILDQSNTLFSEPSQGRLNHGGTQALITQPEFQEPEAVRNLISLVEDEGYVVQLLEDQHADETDTLGRAVITIGSENSDEKMDPYSLVTAKYRVGETSGTVGILGPMRMNYTRVVALVENMALLLSRTGDERQAR